MIGQIERALDLDITRDSAYRTRTMTKPTNPQGHRARIHEIIFEADTRAGRVFDEALIWCIVLSVAAVMLDSVRAIRDSYGELLTAIEWFFTLLFTIEYLLRLYSGRATVEIR